jgi:hypothetical protein
MPLTRVSLRRGKPAAYRKAILDGVYLAMRETFNVPEDDRFMLIAEHDADDFSYGADYLGIRRSDDLVIIQITVSNTRTLAQKQALFVPHRRAADARPGAAPRGRAHQPGRGGAGELVVRARHRPICRPGGMSEASVGAGSTRLKGLPTKPRGARRLHFLSSSTILSCGKRRRRHGHGVAGERTSRRRPAGGIGLEVSWRG